MLSTPPKSEPHSWIVTLGWKSSKNHRQTRKMTIFTSLVHNWESTLLTCSLFRIICFSQFCFGPNLSLWISLVLFSWNRQDRSKGQKEGVWSGEATRSHGLAVDDTSVKISFGEGDDDPTKSKTRVPKERPIWMTTSTVIDQPATPVTLFSFFLFLAFQCSNYFCIPHVVQP